MFFNSFSPKIGEVEIESVADMFANGLRDGYSTGIGDAFQAHSYVDAVAENIFAFDDDITKINADAKLDATIPRHIDVSFANFLLNFHGARNRADHAWKFGQDAISGKFDDASLMLRNVLVDYFGSNLIERGECAGLVERP